MANTVKLKRSAVAGKVPLAADLDTGELAVNLVDRRLFTKDAGGAVVTLGADDASNLVGIPGADFSVSKGAHGVVFASPPDGTNYYAKVCEWTHSGAYSHFHANFKISSRYGISKFYVETWVAETATSGPSGVVVQGNTYGDPLAGSGAIRLLMDTSGGSSTVVQLWVLVTGWGGFNYAQIEDYHLHSAVTFVTWSGDDAATSPTPPTGITATITNAITTWHDENDGAGSGLDADLLDGFQASQFLRSDISASGANLTSLNADQLATGTLPAARFNDTAHGNRSGGSLHSAATTSVSGFMSAADKTKLDGVATSANNYSHPTGDGNLHVPATGTTNNGNVLKAGATAGSFSWGTLSYTDVGAAAASHTHNYAGSASAGGAATSVAQTLTRGAGLTGNNFNGSAATTWDVAYGTTAGTACQGNDSRLSDSRPASDVYAWAKASVKPTYTAAEVGAATSSHTHSYLPLTGGTLTNKLTISANKGATPSYNGGQVEFQSTNGDPVVVGLHRSGYTATSLVHASNGIIVTGTSYTSRANVEAQDVIANGFTQLGESSVGIKLKKLTTTTPTVNNGTQNVAHGLTGSKILQAFATIEFATGEWGVPNTDTAGYECRIRWDNTNVTLNLVGANSANILNKNVTITIIYEA